MLRRRAAKIGIVFFFPIVLLLLLIYALMPNYAATFLLSSDIEVSEVRLSFERQPTTRAFHSMAADRLFAWDTIVARGTRPTPFVEVTWRGPDGRQHSVRQVVLHEDGAPRCIHAIHLNAAGEAVPLGVLPNGEPLLIASRCR